MNNNLSQMAFLMINIISTMFMISTNCWINCFIALEINLFFFIPMIFIPNMFNLEMVLKYFIIQVSSSIIMMTSILLFKTNMQNLNLIWIIIMNLALMMKMGSAPLHYWYIEISNIISWKMFFMLSTWQKIGPMIILFYNMNFYLMMISIFMNSVISMLGGINQIIFKKILAFSSINHLSWMMSSNMISEMMMLNYMMIYMMMMFIITMKINQLNFLYLHQIMTIKMKKKIFISFFVYFMSLSGLPPFLGFIPKWMTINKMIESKFFFLSFIIIMSSLLNLFYYFKMSYYFLMFKNYKMSFKIMFM
uniref:NADH-ubiquinone oxidoreductase chain 2 n=1 Tax=Polycentropus flavomaculatus TaxID=185640 RepID=A0A7D7A975_9NEOP|nr:NADH dehydrogenase subunit 2 [Polycentropus flavomaculatus]